MAHRVQHLSDQDRPFQPKSKLDGKQNFGRHVFVAEDATLHEAVRLNVWNDRTREELIAFHVWQQYREFRGGTEIGVKCNVTGRDCPWDFKWELTDGIECFVEITRVADIALLKAIKAENEVEILLNRPMLTGAEVQKVERLFPSTIDRPIVDQIRTRADRRKIFTRQPSKGGPRLFIRPPMQPARLDLTREISRAIEKKASKQHEGKTRTILILDNLTTHLTPRDFFNSAEEISDFLQEVPFPEIWVYTGYYSSDDGQDAEYCFLILKTSIA